MAPAIRNANPEDYAHVASVVDAWWGGRPMVQMLPKLFFVHFRETSFVMEAEGQIAGFLCAFFSQTYNEQVYCHFIGVNPSFRNAGVGRGLYETLFEVARANRRREVHAVTSPNNEASVRFHCRLGFTVLPGDATVGDTAYTRDYDGAGESRVHLCKQL